MNEIWKNIKGYEGLYQISNQGRIKSINHIVKTSNQYGAINTRLVKGKLLTMGIDKDGYFTISLCKNNITKTKRIHRLVAETFVSNPNKFLLVNHKDEDKQNNKIGNLEWCTHKYNTNYNKMPFRRAKSRRRKVLQYDLKGIFLKEWCSISEASAYYGVSHGNISSCCNKKRKKAFGFIWRYSDELSKMRSLEKERGKK